MQYPELFDAAISVLNLHTGWFKRDAHEAETGKSTVTLDSVSNCIAVLVNQGMLRYYPEYEIGTVPAYVIAPWRTYRRANAQANNSDQSINMNLEMKKSVREWNPTEYDLRLITTKELVCRFVAPNMTEEQLERSRENNYESFNELEDFKNAFKMNNIDKRVFEIVRTPVQRKYPCLEIETDSGTYVIRTPLPRDLFPFPHYQNAAGWARKPSNWKSVQFDKGTRKVTVTYHPLQGEDIAPKIYHVSPMQWAEIAWEQLKKQVPNLEEERIKSVKEVDIPMNILRPKLMMATILQTGRRFSVIEASVDDIQDKVINRRNPNVVANAQAMIGGYFF